MFRIDHVFELKGLSQVWDKTFINAADGAAIEELLLMLNAELPKGVACSWEHAGTGVLGQTVIHQRVLEIIADNPEVDFCECKRALYENSGLEHDTILTPENAECFYNYL